MSIHPAHGQNILDMLSVAESSLQDGKIIPTLVLTYSLIDSMSWVAQPQSPNLRDRFEAWAAKWLLPKMSQTTPTITVTDLYAARCALLHTGTGVSDLYKAKKARRFLYSWGKADVRVLEYAIASGAVPRDHVAMHCDDFLSAVRIAVADFIESADTDQVLAKRLESAANLGYTNLAYDSGQGTKQ